MRIIFAGTPVFAERALTALSAAGHDLVLVLTRADKPAGRGQRLQASPVKQSALRLGVPLLQPASLADPALVQALTELRSDLMVVAAYGRLLPASILIAPRLGCLNIHASLLPRWRGAAPIQRAIQAGDRQTGITIMQMDEGLDTGPMLLKAALPIGPQENAQSLHDRLAQLGGTTIVRALDMLEHGSVTVESQSEQGVTYAKKIEKSESRIDWNQSAQTLMDKIRAFDPTPGCCSSLVRQPDDWIKIWRAVPLDDVPALFDSAPIGAVRSDASARLCVRCADGWLQLLELQRPGGRRVTAAQFVHGAKFDPQASFAAG